MASDSTTRFSTRVENYVRYRPSYPPEVISLLRAECGLSPQAAVADIGSGTGILTRLLLESGAQVSAVEPNQAMREAAEAELSAIPGFHSFDGTAENTGLPAASVDIITAAQAFHWFDAPLAKREFQRILKPGGWAALIWNERIETGSHFLEGYESILREFASDYLEVRHNAITPAKFEAFFVSGMKVARFPNGQRFNFEGVKGRLLSSSYAPPVGDPGHEPMLSALRSLYDTTSEADEVEFRYETQVFFGQLG